ncbi:hypothetical protein E4U60_006384 [Claviceps pazoutovae]|uniref:Uncharacterized protein n=1 Tax=Claviceps pazoutovae TaxID=1649127 RepID=A0A9P7M709_9HYPO|nr:hypothetical protein E4U60_006384 [Claviceps pazoutovae]
MADGTTDPLAAATGRVTRSTAQAAASASSATLDTAAYLTRDMLPDRLSRFADYVTAAWKDRRTIIDQHSTSLDIDNKLAYLYNYYVEHGKTTVRTGPSPPGKRRVHARAKKCATSSKSTASTSAKGRGARSQRISTASLPGT